MNKLHKDIIREAVQYCYRFPALKNTDFGFYTAVTEYTTAIVQGKIRHYNQPFPKIACLCGSTRFWRTFQQASLRETMDGRIVLSIGAASGTDDEHFGNLPREEYDRVKAMLDDLHLRKIDMADEILVLNVDGYVGESTSNEIRHAHYVGKPIRWWEEPAADTLKRLGLL